MTACAIAALGSAGAAQCRPRRPLSIPSSPRARRWSEKTPFATIRKVPPSPTGDVKPQRQTYRTQYEWYAQENGISVEEAKRRTSEQIQVQSIFKRDPEATLGKYSVHPRFRAAKAAYTEAELRALAEPWVERFTEAGIMGGYSVDGTRGTVEAACGDGQVVNVGNPEREARFKARYPGN